MYIAIDFDGTCVTHEYPRVGKSIGSEYVLRRVTDNGHKLILNTMRSNQELADAVQWFEQHNIPLYGVNKNPTQGRWTDSTKAFAHLYIDDAALGCPLHKGINRPYVDWVKVSLELIDKGCLLPEELKVILPEVLNAQNNLEIQ